MASHFSTIGFPVKSVEDYKALTESLVDATITHPHRRGSYLQWRSSTGAETWLQIDRHQQLLGMNPHYAGGSRLKVRVTQMIAGEQLDGSFHAWMIADESEGTEGLYPFLFDSPDFHLHQDVVLPSVATVQLAAFAHELTIYPNQEAHAQSQEGEVKFASQSFIPSGLFSLEENTPHQPQATAIFTGHVVNVHENTNERTGNRFFSAQVDTLGGVFDVAIDPELVTQPILVGGVISGSFWLSGRLIEYQRKPRSLLSRIFG